MNIGGTWEGQYTFGEAYGDYTGTTVRFAMNLKCGGVLRLIGRPLMRGSIRDNVDDGGAPGLATFLGQRIGARVQFVKTMSTSIIDDITMAEVRCELRQRGHAQPGYELPKHRILYNGEVLDHGERMTGSWVVVPPLIESVDGFARLEAHGEGSWSARRTSPMNTEV